MIFPREVLPMPFKYNQSVRHKIPKQKFKVINSAEYNEALRKRGDFMLLISDDALKLWQARVAFR